MKQRTRIYYTPAQRSEMWDRWQRGESMSSIGRAFDRESSSVYGILSPTGGIRPPLRKRSRLALTLSEREEISRGVARNGCPKHSDMDGTPDYRDKCPGTSCGVKTDKNGNW